MTLQSVIGLRKIVGWPPPTLALTFPTLATTQRFREYPMPNDIDRFKESLRHWTLVLGVFQIAFGCIIAVGVVYNAAQVALAERSRDLASLRVLGFTRGEISGILLGELAVVVLASLPVGSGLGYGLAWVIANTVDSEAIRMPIVIYPATY